MMEIEKQIITRINQIWKELLKETTIERLAIKVIQLKQLFVILDRKDLIMIEPNKISSNIDINAEIKKSVIEELGRKKE